MKHKTIPRLAKGVFSLGALAFTAFSLIETASASYYPRAVYGSLGGNSETDNLAQATEVLSEAIALSKTGAYRTVAASGAGNVVWVGNSNSKSYFMTVDHIRNAASTNVMTTYDGTTIPPVSGSILHRIATNDLGENVDFGLLEYNAVLDPSLFGGTPAVLAGADPTILVDATATLVGSGRLSIVRNETFDRTRTISTSVIDSADFLIEYETLPLSLTDPIPGHPFGGVATAADSGGGLFVKVGNVDVLLGNTSVSDSNRSFASTNIFYHRAYIESIVPAGVLTWHETLLPSFTPDPSKKYYIDSPHHNLRIGATGEGEDPFTTSTSTTGGQVEWVFVDKGNGSWHIQLAAGGSKPRLRSRNNGEADMQAASSSGSFTYYDFATGALSDSYFVTLPDHDESRSRLQVSNRGVVKFVPETSSGTWESLRFTEVTASTVHLRKRNASGFALDGSANSNNGQNVYLWSYNATNQNQQWEEIDRGGGYFSYQKAGTNFSLDGGRDGERNQNVYLWQTDATNYNQQWRKESVGGGAYKLIKRNAAFAIHSDDGGFNGQNVDLYESSDSSQNLQWFVE